MSLLATLDGFFASRAPLEPGDGVVVAHSGGPDSTALLAALCRWARGRRLSITAAHFDHGLDPGSAERAHRAAGIARRLGVDRAHRRQPVAALRRRGESLEEAARRLRYAFLEEVRSAGGARYVATAHHRDDQAETVLLRLLQGTGWAGLAGIAERRGALIRPLLRLPRHRLARWLELHGPPPVDDPTNRDLSRPRNRLRHRVLPALAAARPGAVDLAALAAAADGAGRALERRLLRLLAPRPADGGLELERRRLADLPAELRAAALAVLHRLAGAGHPPGGGALRELGRQLDRGGEVGCDCGGGWRLEARGERLRLARRPPTTAAPFAYTLSVPGEVTLPPGNEALRLSRQMARPWMFESSGRRAGLSLRLAAGDRITVRSRRPGDRIRPFGCFYDRRLKDVLIDRKVPRRERDRLPLLCVGRRVLWVPGVTLDESCRLAAGEPAWVAEWERR